MTKQELILNILVTLVVLTLIFIVFLIIGLNFKLNFDSMCQHATNNSHATQEDCNYIEIDCFKEGICHFPQMCDNCVKAVGK